MAKWISPAQRAAQEREREVARIVALARSEADAAVQALTATWQEALPDDYQDQTFQLVSAAVKPHIPAESPHKFLFTSVTGVIYEPHRETLNARFHREQRAREKAAEALVDTNRPVVATITGTYRIGEPAILSELNQQTGRFAERVLVCIASYYRDVDYEANEDGGAYSELAEPTDAERATEPFRQEQTRVDERRAYDEQQMRLIDQRRQRALDAIRAEGREPTLFEDLFAGTSDN